MVESVEEKIMSLKASKRSLLIDMMEDTASMNQITIDDLHYLLE
jgi:hypothetical protein